MPNKLATKSKIVMVFLQLMLDKPYEKITVKDICKRANISRMTFYRNFHTKEDLIIYHFDIMYSSFLQQLLTNPTHRFYDVARIFFQLVKDDQDALEAIVNNQLDWILRKRIRYYVRQLIGQGVLPVTSDSSELLIAMISGGLTDMLITWNQNGMNESVEYMVVFTTKYFNQK